MVAIGFLFEAEVLVSFHAIPILNEEDKPLDAVPDEEGQVEEFALLCCVDELVVELHLVQRTDGEDEAKKADCQEAFFFFYPFD